MAEKQKEKGKARKALRFLGVAAAILAAGVIVLPWCLGPVIAGSIRTIAPRVLGVPVTVDKVSLSAISGKVKVHGFEIGNPGEFDTPYLLNAGKILVDVNMRDLCKGQVHIEEIHVIGPKVWYHRKLTSSNLSELLDGLDKRFPSEEKDGDGDKGKKPRKKGKPVVIDHFLFDEGKLGVKVGVGTEIPLAKIELFDVGKDGAFMPVQIARILLGAIFDSVVHAAASVGGAATDAAGAAVDAVGNAAGSLIEGAKSIFK